MKQPSLEIERGPALKDVEKAWGNELWIANRNGYCGKLLYIMPYHRCSLHMHPVKAESFCCLTGTVYIDDGEGNGYNLRQYDTVHVPVGSYHRFANYGVEPALLVEFSTTHDDADVVRKTESGIIQDETPDDF